MRTPPGRNLEVKNLNFTGPFGADMLNSGSSRRRGWILRCRKLEPGVSRAPYALWDPIFGHVAPEKFKIHLFRLARLTRCMYYSLRSLGAHITWRYLGRKMGPRRRPDLSRESVAAFDHGESSRDNEKALRHFQNGKTDV